MQKHHLVLGMAGTLTIIALIAFALNQDELAAIIQDTGFVQEQSSPQSNPSPIR
jgi:hypothetical protein